MSASRAERTVKRLLVQVPAVPIQDPVRQPSRCCCGAASCREPYILTSPSSSSSSTSILSMQVDLDTLHDIKEHLLHLQTTRPHVGQQQQPHEGDHNERVDRKRPRSSNNVKFRMGVMQCYGIASTMVPDFLRHGFLQGCLPSPVSVTTALLPNAPPDCQSENEDKNSCRSDAIDDDENDDDSFFSSNPFLALSSQKRSPPPPPAAAVVKKDTFLQYVLPRLPMTQSSFLAGMGGTDVILPVRMGRTPMVRLADESLDAELAYLHGFLQEKVVVPATQVPPYASAAVASPNAGAATVANPIAASITDALSVVKLDAWLGVLWSVVLHVANQPMLDHGTGPSAILYCATEAQCHEVKHLLDPIAASLRLVVHNTFDPLPVMPDHRRADLVITVPIAAIRDWLPTPSVIQEPLWSEASIVQGVRAAAWGKDVVAPLGSQIAKSMAAGQVHNGVRVPQYVYQLQQVSQIAILDFTGIRAMGGLPYLEALMDTSTCLNNNKGGPLPPSSPEGGTSLGTFANAQVYCVHSGAVDDERLVQQLLVKHHSAGNVKGMPQGFCVSTCRMVWKETSRSSMPLLPPSRPSSEKERSRLLSSTDDLSRHSSSFVILQGALSLPQLCREGLGLVEDLFTEIDRLGKELQCPSSSSSATNATCLQMSLALMTLPRTTREGSVPPLLSSFHHQEEEEEEEEETMLTVLLYESGDLNSTDPATTTTNPLPLMVAKKMLGEVFDGNVITYHTIPTNVVHSVEDAPHKHDDVAGSPMGVVVEALQQRLLLPIPHSSTSLLPSNNAAELKVVTLRPAEWYQHCANQMTSREAQRQQFGFLNHVPSSQQEDNGEGEEGRFLARWLNVGPRMSFFLSSASSSLLAKSGGGGSTAAAPTPSPSLPLLLRGIRMPLAATGESIVWLHSGISPTVLHLLDRPLLQRGQPHHPSVCEDLLVHAEGSSRVRSYVVHWDSLHGEVSVFVEVDTEEAASEQRKRFSVVAQEQHEGGGVGGGQAAALSSSYQVSLIPHEFYYEGTAKGYEALEGFPHLLDR